MLREVPSNKLSMADTCGVRASDEPQPFMPHLAYGKEELEVRHPRLQVPEAVDAEDPQANEVDGLLEEGLRVARDLVKTVEEQGRRRRLAGAPQGYTPPTQSPADITHRRGCGCPRPSSGVA